ncbi:MAG: FAD-binding protein [Halieaceae bacterium]|jgi:3-oxosteroid 1-dehydrogenase|nr:FAD-binding protein [Halieaceae bacterium]
MQSEDVSWDHEVDFLIVGSGAGAMTAAIVAHDLGARTLLIEKSPQFGGSSAMSGGGLWIPNNHLMNDLGFEDSSDKAMAYLKSCVGSIVPEARLTSYLENAPKAVQYLCEKTHLNLHVVPDYADYYQELPGSLEGGRCLEATPFDGSQMNEEEFLQMRATPPQALILGRISMAISEAQALLTHSPGWIMQFVKLALNYIGDIPWRFRSKRDRRCSFGNALIGPLYQSLKERNVPLWLNTSSNRLLVEDGRVVGVEANKEGEQVNIRAVKGVLLAAGGFDNNPAMRKKFLPDPSLAQWSCGNPYSTGDAITMGQQVGAGLELMDEAWWGPTVVVPGEERARMMVIEKSLPGGMLVDKNGKRFVKETSAYDDVVKAMYANNTSEAPCIPAYLIFDARFRKKYPVGPLLPGAQLPDWAVSSDIKKHFVRKADSLEALAHKMGIDVSGLNATVEKMNEYALSGRDLDFGRGENAFDQFYGDKSVTPNPCMAPIAKAPFYGIEVYPGELGTKGGLKVDERARVLGPDSDLIPGLYATGNCSAPVFGRTYPGAGSTLGPTTTFGYVAARDALE